MTPVEAIFADDVGAEFDRLSPAFEGAIPWMYLDIKGLVTCAIGVLIDPLPLALPLPWVRALDGKPATDAEIRAEWALIKGSPSLATRGAGAARSLCNLRLTTDGVQQVTRDKAEAMARALLTHFPAMVAWPAQARLALLLHVWAVGTNLPKTYPRMTAALRAMDWQAAQTECHISEVGNPGVAPRNRKIKALFGELAETAPTVPPDPTPTQPMTDAEREAILALNDETTTASLLDRMADFLRER